LDPGSAAPEDRRTGNAAQQRYGQGVTLYGAARGHHDPDGVAGLAAGESQHGAGQGQPEPGAAAGNFAAALETADGKALICPSGCLDSYKAQATNTAPLGPRSSIVSQTIRDTSVLNAAYKHFMKQGGMFIPTNKSYRPGDQVFMLLNLMDQPEKIPVAGK